MSASRRIHFLVFIVSVFAMGAAGPAVWAASENDSHAQTKDEVSVAKESIAGTVTRIKSSAIAVQNAVPRPLMVGSPIYVGDVISTSSEARLEITMIDDAVMTLGASAIFIVLDYIYQGDGGNAATRLLSGALRSTSGNISKPKDKPFKLYSEFGTIGIRGTDFWAGYLHGEFHVGLLSGAGVYVENDAGRVEITRIGYGAKIIKRGAAPTPPKPWANDMLNMSKDSVSFE
ncbi:MAG: FecR family protein [Proteobacteria bacterium]|nr:FecR family protein [Pseudomonadota bacterium]